MGVAFNLIDQPWIPCLMNDGAARELSLGEVFEQANQVREIFDESPLVTVALHRLLLAILHRNFGPAGIKEWLELWRKGWNLEVLEAYCTRWHRRFDLFHPERPFYQALEMKDGARQPISTLFQQFANGNNTTLFDHNFEDEPPCLTFAAGARGVVARQAFSVGFGRSNPFYFSDSPLIRRYSLLISGNNLFETLLLNLVRYDSANPIPRSKGRDDLPQWEREHPEEPRKEGTIPNGYLDYLTWQSRRIRLSPEPDGSGVRWCQLQQNLKLADSASAIDPFKCYRKDDKRGWVALSFREERALWRDSHTLMQQLADAHRPPAVLKWIAEVGAAADRESIPLRRLHSLSAFGVATDIGKAASVTLWRQERLPLPFAFLSDGGLLEKLSAAVAYAEDLGRDLRGAAWTLARTLLEPPVEGSAAVAARARREDVEPLARSFGAERRYWPALEAPFLTFMTLLADALPEARDDHLAIWRKRVRDTARDAFSATIRDLDLTARQLRAGAIAERFLNRKLAELTEADEQP